MTDYSAHEAMHTASVLMDTYGTHVGEHPFVEANPDIAAKVESAIEAMMEVYQAIGQMHLAEDLKQGLTEALDHAKGEGDAIVHEPKATQMPNKLTEKNIRDKSETDDFLNCHQECDRIWVELGSPIPCLHPKYLEAREKLLKAARRSGHI